MTVNTGIMHVFVRLIKFNFGKLKGYEKLVNGAIQQKEEEEERSKGISPLVLHHHLILFSDMIPRR